MNTFLWIVSVTKVQHSTRPSYSFCMLYCDYSRISMLVSLQLLNPCPAEPEYVLPLQTV